jgi:hypothetical protein
MIIGHFLGETLWLMQAAQPSGLKLVSGVVANRVSAGNRAERDGRPQGARRVGPAGRINSEFAQQKRLGMDARGTGPWASDFKDTK